MQASWALLQRGSAFRRNAETSAQDERAPRPIRRAQGAAQFHVGATPKRLASVALQRLNSGMTTLFPPRIAALIAAALLSSFLPASAHAATPLVFNTTPPVNDMQGSLAAQVLFATTATPVGIW